MKRRTFFGVGVALAASLPALAQLLKFPKREPLGLKEDIPHYIRHLYVEAERFDGWNVQKDCFRIEAHRFPVGTEENHWWEFSVPIEVVRRANFIQVIDPHLPRDQWGDGKVLKDRLGMCRRRDPVEVFYAPLVDDEWLITRGYRIARNESYTSIEE